MVRTSRTRQRITLTLPVRPGVEAALRHARRAEAEGFDDVWFSDPDGIDALSPAAVGVETRRAVFRLAEPAP